MFLSLAVPAFISGVLMFLAPCTLPLVPAYLVFIGGGSFHGVQTDKGAASRLRSAIVRNALFYVLGFSVVFILLGALLGTLGGLGLGNVRFVAQRVSGGIILILGLAMMGVLRLPGASVFSGERLQGVVARLSPGKPWSAFVFGAAFAFGWSPCIGPILGSVLLLASSSGTIAQGMGLLAIFSLGLGLPFFLLALAASQATKVVRSIGAYARPLALLGGACIALIGFLLLTGNMGVWTQLFAPFLGWFDEGALWKYL